MSISVFQFIPPLLSPLVAIHFILYIGVSTSVLQIRSFIPFFWASQVVLKSLPANAGAKMQVQSLGWEDPLEEGMATHSSILSWRIPWIEEPGGLQFIGMQRVRHE